jgi:hypothetical protein
MIKRKHMFGSFITSLLLAAACVTAAWIAAVVEVTITTATLNDDFCSRPTTRLTFVIKPAVCWLRSPTDKDPKGGAYRTYRWE